MWAIFLFQKKVQICFSLFERVTCLIKYPSPFSKFSRFEFIQIHAFWIQRNQIELKQKKKRSRIKKRGRKGCREPFGPRQVSAHGPLIVGTELVRCGHAPTLIGGAHLSVISYLGPESRPDTGVWGPWITHPEYPICIQFTIPWSVCRESTYPSW
jgi:hypothetical protein